ncbi:polyribonucleotide nucleotidyltransferase [Candidatus Falkowbacteria bacterium RBG_13_39_14]|uniref:Polyribonucleotide nucleotidyltransferase n=1 Tax=Candidatus Falkowbacteria bacterium RBG_13_39_14 TaxID=1797985 RepID=A0A1F5S143_9BACT|nr:MAG: polyribonucleotide nucleotidyltransferase [Candidatus Falkowbacteria bacterium RBG_13_39_14]
MDIKRYSVEYGGRELTIETGKLANQALASCTVQYGDTQILATVVKSEEARQGIDFFPLMVDYEERLYAAGKIKGSRFIKREGRPTDEAILSARMVDRSIRPLFNEESREDIQIILTVLSIDQQNAPDIVALIAASAALSMSGIDWRGPIAGAGIAEKDGNFIFNPTAEELAESNLDITVAGTADKIIMIEAGCKEVKENKMIEAIKFAQTNFGPLLTLLQKIKAETAPIAIDSSQNNAEKTEIIEKAKKWLSENINAYLFDEIKKTKEEKNKTAKKIENDLKELLLSTFPREENADPRLQELTNAHNAKLIKEACSLVDAAIKHEVSRMIIEEERRIDGRKLDEIRPLYIEAGLIPRTHGSGLFTRGQTQVLSLVTLGSPGDEQILDTMELDEKKRYMHHYNFPPFSVGEAKPLRGTSRREVGHGALAEKALMPVLPQDKEKFPYTIRVVSEVLGSNGSSSMGSTCGSSLSLMDAGVPIKAPVAGIAMGLASDSAGRWKVITDLQDVEDGNGGMDFKITGTKDGITAIQMDTKTEGLTSEMIEQTFKQGLEARLRILEEMGKVIAEPRADLSPYAPRITSFMINPDKIREVIGPGGKVINEIIDNTGVTIDIEDSGLVMVCSSDAEASKKAVEWIQNIVKEVEVGEEYLGKVTRIMDFGAFVEVLPKQEGLVHVSELAPFRVNHPQDIVHVGDMIKVKVIEIDSMGRINLSHKATQEGAKREMPKGYEAQPPRPSRPRFNDRHERGGGRQYRW